MKSINSFEQAGDVITLPAPYAVDGGDGMSVGALFGIAANKAASGASVECCTTGVFRIAADSALTGSPGAPAYWDSVNRRCASSGMPIGNLVATKLAGATVATVRVVGPAPGTVDGAGNSFRFALSGGVLLACLGDSITYQNTNGSALNLRAVGYASWANALSGGLLQFSNDLNFGVSGDSSTQVLARTDAAIVTMKAASVQYCVVHAGTNDLYAPVTYATTIANLQSIYSKLLGAGVTPIVIPIIPRAKNDTTGSMTTAERQSQQRINNWIRDYVASNPSILIADPTVDIVDHSVTNGDPIGALTAATTAHTKDGLHPSPRAAYFMGKAIVTALQYRLVGISRRAWSQADTFDATNNPSGNFMSNGYLTGIGGTNGTASSGPVATSWTSRRLAGSTGAVVASKGTIATGNGTTYPTQILAFSAAAGSATESMQLYQQKFSGWSAGDVFVCECDVSVSGVGPGSLKECFLQLADDTQQMRHLAPETGFYMPDQSWSGTLRTPPVTMLPGSTVLTATLQASLDGTVGSNAVTVTISRIRVYKVGA
jgi:predicted RecA/RadA family phage recombinase/lysophospholipase L1-like esterase